MRVGGGGKISFSCSHGVDECTAKLNGSGVSLLLSDFTFSWSEVENLLKIAYEFTIMGVGGGKDVQRLTSFEQMTMLQYVTTLCENGIVCPILC